MSMGSAARSGLIRHPMWEVVRAGRSSSIARTDVQAQTLGRVALRAHANELVESIDNGVQPHQFVQDQLALVLRGRQHVPGSASTAAEEIRFVALADLDDLP